MNLLSLKEIKLIRELYDTDKYTIDEIAKMTAVSRSAIRHQINLYKHLRKNK